MRILPATITSILLLLLAAPPLSTVVAAKKSAIDALESAPRVPVAIVFGAGLRNDGRPSDVLRDRLSVAAKLYRAGAVKRILVSGDNRFETYNEPQAMRDALVEDFGIDPSALAIDFAGRRTYDTCARAAAYWNVDRAILVSQSFHLPRAVWTCRHLGIEAFGASASLRPYAKARHFTLREIPAIWRAWWDTYVQAPNFVQGEFIEDLSSPALIPDPTSPQTAS